MLSMVINTRTWSAVWFLEISSSIMNNVIWSTKVIQIGR